MSSRSAALVARAAMFALEALEPRRFLSAGDVTEAIPLDVEAGAELRGEYGGRQTVRFSFEAREGVPYIFTDADWSSYRPLMLLAEDGTVLGLEDHTGRVEWTAPSSGTYFLELENSADDVRTYHVTGRIFRDDYADNPAEATALPEGLRISGHLDGAADQDWFSFQADAAHVYRIRSDDNDLYNAYLSIYAPDGSTVYDADALNHETPPWDIVVTPGVAGTYFIKAADIGEPYGQASGNLYSISVDVITDDAGEEPKGAVKWDIGQPLHGEIQYYGDRDSFAFDATAGQTLVFDKTGLQNMDLRDVESNFAIADTEYQIDGGRIVWIVPQTGTYYLSLYNGLERFGYKPIAYSVSVASITPSVSTDITPETPVSGALTDSVDVNIFHFSASSGSLYTFEISPEAGSSLNYLMDVAARCEWISSYSGDNLHRQWPKPPEFLPVAQCVPRESGEFYVSVSSVGTIDGGYTLTMHEIRDDHSNLWFGDPTLLKPDQAQHGAINFIGDDDAFVFDAIKGHVYSVNLRLGDYQVNPFNPGLGSPESVWGGDQISSHIETDREERVGFVAAYTSRYRFDVNEYAAVGYAVQVTEMTPSRPGRNAPTIAPGQTVQVAIDAPNTVRYVRFAAVRGMEYVLKLDAQAPELAVYVVGAAGELTEYQRSQALSSENEYHWVADQTHTVYFALAAFDPAQTGDFSLHLEAVPTEWYEPPPPPPEPEIPPPPPPPDDQLDQFFLAEDGYFNGVDLDVFRFHAIAGRAYTFKTILKTLDDSLLALFDPFTGELMAFNDDTDDETIAEGQELSSRIQWTAPATDDVYIVAGGYEGTFGSYKLVVESGEYVGGLEAESLTRVRISAEAMPTAGALENEARDEAIESADGDSDHAEVWDDSGDWLDSDVWGEDENWSEI